MYALIQLISVIASLIQYVVFAYVVMSLLLQFGVLNGRQPLVAQIWRAVSQIADTLLDPIRRVVPMIGNIDFSPLVLLIGVNLLSTFLIRDLLLPLAR